ncbi:MAG TPA: DUF5990 family protein, partial [Streptosporangiaceae bacterium]|nr:DUF5990 family protein [Streptosporangiaceae bacterium]
MSSLPDRPDLAQLRRQARELQRAAAGGDPGAVRRIQQVSAETALSAAQLTLAREYGFGSWAKLKDEAERRRASAPDTAPPVLAWAEPWRDYLVADGDDDPDALIENQYADRPQLRPILDAALAVLPGLGPVTVQPRRTLVTLFTPRRAFAAIRATTRNRVDLGLRLDGTGPGGRLLAAGNVGGGGVTVRIALSHPEDVDDEVRDLMRRAYTENSGPPPPRRPARRPGAKAGTMTVVIEGSELPGRACQPGPDGRHENVHVALGGRSTDRTGLAVPGRPGMAIEPVPGDAAAARWEMPVTVRRDDDGFDFAGPFVRGARDDRHLGLIWGDLTGDGTLRLFRGAKLRLVDVDPELIQQALRPGHTLIARIRLTDAKGNPICARVHPPYLTWSVT